MNSDEVPAAPAPQWRRWGLLAAAFSLVVAAGVLAWERSHPDVAFDYGYGIGMKRAVGSTVWTTLADSESLGSSAITFTELDPVFERDGAAVNVEYLVCALDEEALAEDGVGSFGYGLRDQAVRRSCTATSPARGAQLVAEPGVRRELLVGITATQPGRTVISAHRAAYDAGWRRGSSDILVETDLRSR
jgi:hypothetical protein